MEKLESCYKCGTREEEWDPHRDGDRQAYIPQVYVCPGCKATEDAYSSAVDDARKSKRTSSGLHVRLLTKQEHRIRQTQARKRQEEKASK